MRTQKRVRKNNSTILFVASLASLFFVATLHAYAALSCSVTTAAACTDTVVLRMSGATNAHAELPSQSNSAYDNNVICCSGVSGLGNSCSGTYGVVAKLSAVTNAHVERNNQNNYSQNACLSAPGSVTIAYQANNCTGYDTTLASISAATNAQIGNTTAYTAKICGSASAGSLSVDIVDGGGASVASPSVTMTNSPIGFGCQNSTGALGTASQKIRVTNATANAPWTLSIAGSATTALWTDGSHSFDFNDTSGAGCSDGGDADVFAGRMAQNPTTATITPQGGCTTTGLSLGSSTAFSEGVTDAITLVSASGSAQTGCYWDLTSVQAIQTIPLEQPVSSYAMNYVMTIVAN